MPIPNIKTLPAALALGTALTFAAPVTAATLSVDTFPNGIFNNAVAILPEATLTSSGGRLFFGGASLEPGSFCALNISGNCEADLEIAFTSVVSNLIFDASGWDPGDFVELSIYGLGNLLSGTVNITSNVTGLDLTSYGFITRLFFDDSSTGAGVAYSNFRFDQGQTPSPVPLPAAGWMLLTGLGGIAALRRRKLA